LDGVPIVVDKLVRTDCGDVTVGQPLTWTFVEFHVDVDRLEMWAERPSQVLDDAVGWYCDFRSSEETFVVFAGRVFRYPRGDGEGRARAADYARSVGVPESQIDSPE
jgi:hypothetical protein